MNKKGNELVDMHLHTNASDGTWSVEELIEEVNNKDIRYFSITDHDTLKNSKKALQIIPENKEFVIGVEISSTYKNREYHILAYDFDPNNDALVELLTNNQKIRQKHNDDIIKYVKEYELVNNVEDYSNYTADLKRGGWKSLNYLLDKGIVKDLSDYLKLMEISNLTIEFNKPKQVIDRIKKAGGYAILAHPSAYGEDFIDDKVFELWKSFGIDGIECYSPYLEGKEVADYCVEFCKSNNLMISGGSDCHGHFNERSVGEPKVIWKDTFLDLIFNVREEKL